LAEDKFGVLEREFIGGQLVRQAAKQLDAVGGAQEINLLAARYSRRAVLHQDG
jgi:hypothetical protein